MTEKLHRNGRSCINGHLWLADGLVRHRVDTELKGHDVPIDNGQALLGEPPEFYFEGGKIRAETFLASGRKHQPQVDVRGTAGCCTSAQTSLPGDRLDHSTGSSYMCVKATNTETWTPV